MNQPHKFEDEVSQYKKQNQSTRNHSQKNLQINCPSEPNEGNISIHRISQTVLTKNEIVRKNQDTLVYQVSHQSSDIKLKQNFKKIAAKINFSVRQDSDKRIVISKPVHTNYIKQLICCCISINNQTIITFEIRNDYINRAKIVTIKKLVGNANQFSKIVDLQRQQLKTIEKQEKEDHFLYKKRSKHTPLYLEIAAFDFITTALKDKSSQKINQYKERLIGIKKSIQIPGSKKKIQSLIQQLMKMVNEVLEQLNHRNNYHLELLRFSIQKYLMIHLDEYIVQIYLKKYEKKNEAFQNKRNLILQNSHDQKCMKYLQIKQKYRLLNQKNQFPPYFKAIQTLENLCIQTSFRQKLKCVQLYYSHIKICCYQFHKGKQEISTMDDILPVMIFTVLKARVKNFYANIKMIDDYIKVSGKYETDQRLITNLFVGLEYITNQWVIS